MLMKAFFFVIIRPYFRGDATTTYCVNVKAKTMDADIEIGNAEKYAANFIQDSHFVHEGCWKYISMKQVA